MLEAKRVKEMNRIGAGLLAVAMLAYCPASLAANKATETKNSKTPIVGKVNSLKMLVAQAPKVMPANESVSPALISVLKDITKALSESSDYNNLSDAKQKAVVGIALSVLQTALANPQLTYNRIISTEDKAKAENSMSAETWDSGEIITPVCHAVASCIWAKKANGLLNITIAGNTNEIIDGQKLGEFIFVASGRSGVDSGFDIQSQSSVNYWIGKLTNFVADTAGQPVIQTSNSIVSPTVTTTTTTTTTASETTNVAPTDNVAPAATPEKVEDNNHSEAPTTIKESSTTITTTSTPIASKPAENIVEPEEKSPRRSYLLLKAPSLKKIKKTETAQPVKQIKTEVKSQSEDKPVTVTEIAKETTVAGVSEEKPPVVQESTKETIPVVETPPVKIEPQVAIGPSPDALVVTPDKAQAGQLITISVVNARLIPETGVDVDFNGTVLTTGANGQVQYLVPEDSTPGPTLKIAIAGKQLATTKVVHILQPLSTSSEAQVPHVDRVTANASKFDTVTIQGHNFNGQSESLNVIIDGKWAAQILSTSPLELKILVPEEVPAGQHSVCVTKSGLKSNHALFSLISLQVAPDARPGQAPTKLIVRALGTIKPVAVHLRNNTPNIITIVKGNDLRIKTPGGKDNSIAVNVRLKQRGNYNIEASIE